MAAYQLVLVCPFLQVVQVLQQGQVDQPDQVTQLYLGVLVVQWILFYLEVPFHQPGRLVQVFQWTLKIGPN